MNKKNLLGIILGITMAILGSFVWAGEAKADEGKLYYVSQRGDPAHVGTSEQFPTTLEHAIDQIDDDDTNTSATIQLQGGEEVTCNSMVEYGSKIVTLDLNGQTLRFTPSGSQSEVGIIFSGELRIINSSTYDGGTIISNNSSSPIFSILGYNSKLVIGTEDNSGEIKLETEYADNCQHGIISTEGTVYYNVKFVGGNITLNSASGKIFEQKNNAACTVDVGDHALVTTTVADASSDTISLENVTFAEDVAIKEPQRIDKVFADGAMGSSELDPSILYDCNKTPAKQFILVKGPTVSFVADGGKYYLNDTGHIVSYFAGFKSGTTNKLPENKFTRNHYVFNGWKDETSGAFYTDKQEVTFDSADDLTLTAQWTPVEYTLTYDYQGGHLPEGKTNPTTYTIQSKNFKLNNPVKDGGFIFLGWRMDSKTYSDSSPYDSEVIISEGTTGNKTLTAYWGKPSTYQVKFDANGGSTGPRADLYDNPQTMTNDNTANLNPCTFIRNGYSFTGWNTKADGSGTSYVNQASVQNLTTGDEITLYAQWSPDSYTVTFDSNGGSKVEEQSILYGEKAVKPQNPTRSGYTFDKWLLGGREYSFASKVTGNITLKASWTEVKVEKNDPQPQDPDKDDPQKQDSDKNDPQSQDPDNNGPQNQDHDPEDIGPIEPIGDFADVPQGKYYTIPVKWAFENGITTGTSRTRFSPAASCTRGQVMTFLYRAAKGSATPIDRFIDVPANKFYAAPVAWAVANEITTGTGTNTFSPDLTATRAQIVTFIWKAKGCPAASGDASFSDVPDDMWYTDAIKWAATNGITSGIGNGKFGTDQPCTRGQVVTFLYRAFNN